MKYAVVTCLAITASIAQAGTPWADHIVLYEPGLNPTPGYDDPATALGRPTRFTGELGGFPGAVTPFNPPWDTDELVSIGVGGELVLAFDEPVANDPLNPFGIDLLIFGNAFYWDDSFPNGVAGGLFGSGGTIEVGASLDAMVPLPADFPAIGNYPTLGYRDLATPYESAPGSIPTDFTRPVDPTFDATGLAFADIVSAYDGSGGGVGINIGSLGLDSISFVRIHNPPTASEAIEIDALSDVSPVPAPPSTVALLTLTSIRRRRRPR